LVTPAVAWGGRLVSPTRNAECGLCPGTGLNEVPVVHRMWDLFTWAASSSLVLIGLPASILSRVPA
jgi:hypothetical protein